MISSLTIVIICIYRDLSEITLIIIGLIGFYNIYVINNQYIYSVLPKLNFNTFKWYPSFQVTKINFS